MANSFSGNPWTLDTVGTTPLIPANINVDHFEFIDYTADGDTCQIMDASGRVIWEGNGEADLSPVRSGKIGWVSGGLYLKTLSQAASRVRVYLK